MLACRAFQKATGKNLLADNCLGDIFGDGKEKEFNADLYLNYLYACIIDGLYPAPCAIAIDDVAVAIAASDFKLQSDTIKFYVAEKNGMTQEEVEDLLKKNKSTATTTEATN